MVIIKCDDNNLYETVIVKAPLKLQARCKLANHTTNTFSKISGGIIVWSEPAIGVWVSVSENIPFLQYYQLFNKRFMPLQCL